MYIEYLFFPLILALFFVPVLIAYRVLEKNGKKNFWKFALMLSAIYIAIIALIMYGLSLPTID